MARLPDEDRRHRAAVHRRGAWRGVDESNTMGVELLTATLTWAGIGWLLDRWLGTAPWLLAVGALVGNAAGLYLVWLRGGRMDRAEAARLRATRLGPGPRTAPGSGSGSGSGTGGGPSGAGSPGGAAGAGPA